MRQAWVRSIEVLIADESGVLGSRRIEVTVQPPAVAPLFTSTPPVRVLSGLLYRYHATVVDPDLLGPHSPPLRCGAGTLRSLEPATFALLEGPSGMALSSVAMGLLDWDTAGVPPGTYSVTPRATDASGLSTDQSWTIEVLSEDEPPYFVLAPVRDGEVLEFGKTYIEVASPPEVPDPAAIAPALRQDATTPFKDRVAFLYEHDPPVQRGVDVANLNPRTLAVVRGRALSREGFALQGVRISALEQPGAGETFTRSDGSFDLAVQGGRLVTVRYERAGYLPVDRKLSVPWQDFAIAPDVALVGYDSRVTEIELGSGSFQVAEGSLTSDERGQRKATLLFPSHTLASLELPDGSVEAVSRLSVRVTEYTVGPNGPEAMPAELPPTSAYTYALELSADEAVALGARTIELSVPVRAYVDDFLDLPPGTQVPMGMYDREAGVWMPEPNGRVIEVLGSAGELAELDVDGTGPASPALLASLGIDDEERRALATMFGAGHRVWRMLHRHFSPGDYNFGEKCGRGDACEYASMPPPKCGRDLECSGGSVEGQSTVECDNQTLRESFDLGGTPFNLSYHSERVPGRLSAYTVDIPLTGAEVPAGLVRVDLDVWVAGKRSRLSFPPDAEQTHRFLWDGLDAYGRKLVGEHAVTTRLTYLFDAYYTNPDLFGLPAINEIFSGPGWVAFRAPVVSRVERVGAWDARGMSLGGWTLSGHHILDPRTRTIHFGEGGRRELEDTLDTVAGNGDATVSSNSGPAKELPVPFPRSLAMDASGNLFISSGNQIKRLEPDGKLSTIAGTGERGFDGDGGLARLAKLDKPSGLAFDSLGNLYIADSGNHRIRVVDELGMIRTAVGTGEAGFDGELNPLALAKLNSPVDLAFDADGNLYIADEGNRRIRKVTPNGLILTYAGGRSERPSSPGLSSLVYDIRPSSVLIDAAGNLYFSNREDGSIYRVDSGGILTLFAGAGPGPLDDGGPATDASLAAGALAFASDGSMYVADTQFVDDLEDPTTIVQSNLRVRRIDVAGRITTVVGDGASRFSGDGGRGAAGSLASPADLVVDPTGNLFIADAGNHRVRRLLLVPGDVAAQRHRVPSGDGSMIFVFDGFGQHLETVDGRMGTTLLSFEYDAAGRLISATDLDGKTTIERDAEGAPTAVIGPFGHRNELRLNADGYVSELENPAGESRGIEYHDAGGLVSSFRRPRGFSSTYEYDELGRIQTTHDGAGGSLTISRASDTAEGFAVEKTTALGRTTRYEVASPPGVDRVRTVRLPSGALLETGEGSDGTVTSTSPDGTLTLARLAPDPRFGMEAPYVDRTVVRLPSGLSSVTASSRTAELSDASDPLSLLSETTELTVNGRTYVTRYDAATRAVTTRSPLGRETETLLDLKGRISESRVPGLLPVSYGSDALGRVETVAQGTRETRYTYDSLGRLATVRDPLGRTSAMSYDLADRLLVQLRPDGETTTFSYDFMI